MEVQIQSRGTFRVFFGFCAIMPFLFHSCPDTNMSSRLLPSRQPRRNKFLFRKVNPRPMHAIPTNAKKKNPYVPRGALVRSGHLRLAFHRSRRHIQWRFPPPTSFDVWAPTIRSILSSQIVTPSISQGSWNTKAVVIRSVAWNGPFVLPLVSDVTPARSTHPSQPRNTLPPPPNDEP